jgi:hypothetical protein
MAYMSFTESRVFCPCPKLQFEGLATQSACAEVKIDMIQGGAPN